MSKSKSDKSTSEEIPAYDPNKYRNKHILFGSKSKSLTSLEEKEKREADLIAAAEKRKADLIAEKRKADLIAEKREADLIAEKREADLIAAAKKIKADLKAKVKREAIEKMKNDVSKILDFFSEKKKSDIKSITKDYDSQLETNNELKTESLDYYILDFIQLKTDLEGLLIQDQISVDLKELEYLNQRYSRLLPNLESLEMQILNIKNSKNYLCNINFIHLLWGKFKLYYFLNETPTKEYYIDETEFIKLFVGKGSLMLKTQKKSNSKTKKRKSKYRHSNNRPSNGL